MSKEKFSGWGRTAATFTDSTTLRTYDDAQALFASGRSVIARGLGRSYGDPAQVSGGVVAHNLGLLTFGDISETGLVTLGAGVSVDALLQYAIPRGWFIPVTPGTRQVTMGGAFAADVHGKNHHVDGSFARHVRALRILTPTGLFTCSPTEHADLFWATAGGMGLTGIILDLDLQLQPLHSTNVLVDTLRFRNLDAVMDEMLRNDHKYRYSVAWVDCTTKGSSMGRAVLTRGDHAEADGSELIAPSGPRLSIPFDAPGGLLNKLSIRVFNELMYRRAPRQRDGEAQSLGTFFHPLDGLGQWNRLYGPKGFVQYQFVVPDEAGDAVTQAIHTLSHSGVPSFLAVLKRFGEGTPGPLSFPVPGWTLALDVPVGPSRLSTLLDQLDLIVSANGGRVYLAKDARLDPAVFRTMYPQWEAFRAVKDRVDPEGLLTSDLARRLELVRK